MKTSLYEMDGHPMRCAILLQKCCHSSQRGQSHHSLCHVHGSPAHSGPHCSSTGATKPTGPGGVTLFRPPCTDTSMQSLLCTTCIESQALAALGGAQSHSVVLRQHCRYNSWVTHLWQLWVSKENIKLLAKLAAVLLVYMCIWESSCYKGRV